MFSLHKMLRTSFCADLSFHVKGLKVKYSLRRGIYPKLPPRTILWKRWPLRACWEMEVTSSADHCFPLLGDPTAHAGKYDASLYSIALRFPCIPPYRSKLTKATPSQNLSQICFSDVFWRRRQKHDNWCCAFVARLGPPQCMTDIFDRYLHAQIISYFFDKSCWREITKLLLAPFRLVQRSSLAWCLRRRTWMSSFLILSIEACTNTRNPHKLLPPCLLGFLHQSILLSDMVKHGLSHLNGLKTGKQSELPKFHWRKGRRLTSRAKSKALISTSTLNITSLVGTMHLNSKFADLHVQTGSCLVKGDMPFRCPRMRIISWPPPKKKSLLRISPSAIRSRMKSLTKENLVGV